MTREPFLRTRAGRVSLLAMLVVDVFILPVLLADDAIPMRLGDVVFAITMLVGMNATGRGKGRQAVLVVAHGGLRHPVLPIRGEIPGPRDPGRRALGDRPRHVRRARPPRRLPQRARAGPAHRRDPRLPPGRRRLRLPLRDGERDRPGVPHHGGAQVHGGRLPLLQLHHHDERGLRRRAAPDLRDAGPRHGAGPHRAALRGRAHRPLREREPLGTAVRPRDRCPGVDRPGRRRHARGARLRRLVARGRHPRPVRAPSRR